MFVNDIIVCGPTRYVVKLVECPPLERREPRVRIIISRCNGRIRRQLHDSVLPRRVRYDIALLYVRPSSTRVRPTRVKIEFICVWKTKYKTTSVTVITILIRQNEQNVDEAACQQ